MMLDLGELGPKIVNKYMSWASQLSQLRDLVPHTSNIMFIAYNLLSRS